LSIKNYDILRVINNNVILVKEEPKEIELVLIGKGLGFSKRSGMRVRLDDEQIEKSFHTYYNNNKNEYLNLIEQMDDKIVELCSEIILVAQKNMGKLSPRLYIVLTDHIGFAIERIKNGLEVQNPFIYEIKILYPKEYEIGLMAQKMIKEQVGIEINEDEVGFIALHLNAARQNKEVKEALKDTILIKKMVNAIEEGLNVKIDNDTAYNRLVNHFRGSFVRVQNNVSVENPLIKTIQKDLKDCYVISKKVGAIIKENLGCDIPEGELGYLAIHIDRIKRLLKDQQL